MNLKIETTYRVQKGADPSPLTVECHSALESFTAYGFVSFYEREHNMSPDAAEELVGKMVRDYMLAHPYKSAMRSLIAGKKATETTPAVPGVDWKLAATMVEFPVAPPKERKANKVKAEKAEAVRDALDTACRQIRAVMPQDQADQAIRAMGGDPSKY